MNFYEFANAEMNSANEMLKSYEDIDALGEGRSTLLQHVAFSFGWTTHVHQFEKIKVLLALGADPNCIAGFDKTPALVHLADGDNEDGIRLLLQAGANVNLAGERGRSTALCRAVINGHESIVDLLINAGANVNFQDADGSSALTEAISVKQPSLTIVRTLISAGADVNLKAAYARAALSIALAHEQYAMVPLLLEAGADVNCEDKDGRAPLAIACSLSSCTEDAIEMLLDAGATVDAQDSNRQTALFRAAVGGKVDLVSRLLKCGASVSLLDKDGREALACACRAAQTNVAKFLITSGADVLMQDKKGKTPLMLAINGGCGISFLLNAGADVDTQDMAGKTALMHSIQAYGQDVKVLQQLLRKNAQVSIVDGFGQTALHIAASHRNAEAAVLLLAGGIGVNEVDNQGRTALMLCRASNVGEVLLKAGARIDLVDSEGKTALVRASEGYSSDAEKIALLIRFGAALNVQDKTGMTAAMCCARDDSNLKSLKALHAAGADINLVNCEGASASSIAAPDCLRFLLKVGAHPNVFEGSRLTQALNADDVPLTISLLERGAKCSLDLSRFVKCKKTLEKIARSKSELLRSGIACDAADALSEFDRLLARFAQSQDVASESELPEILRAGAWPVQVLMRKPLVVPAEAFASIEYFNGTLHWADGQREDLIKNFLDRSPAAKKKPLAKDEVALGSLEKLERLLKIRKFEFVRMFSEGSESFVSFWNQHAGEIAANNCAKLYLPMRSIHVEYLLAEFGISVLPGIVKAADSGAKIAEALRLFDAPVCARLMSQWMADGNAARSARWWVLAYPESCVLGLLAAATGKLGKERSGAEATLRYLAKKGHRSLVESTAAKFGQATTESVQEVLLQDPSSDFMPKKVPNLPKFWSAEVYPAPRLLLGGKALSPRAVDTLAAMMSMSHADLRTAALEEVIQVFEPKSLSKFAWGAFEEWAKKGSKDAEWIFESLAYLGDDDCARKLTPYIRDWPRQNGFSRALKGLEILAAIGTDVALTQIQSIALKNKYKSVLDHAQLMMESIARARNMTPEQFEDRLVPTFGFSEKGIIDLDFGARHFVVSVNAKLLPTLVNEAGEAIKALPAAAKADDATRAKESAEIWSELCKDLRPAAKLQLERLELAMVHSRRWSGLDFKSQLMSHPLLQAVVRGLVWGVFPSKSKLSVAFVVNAQGESVDVNGKPMLVADTATVGIVHPVMLTGPKNPIEPWQQQFSQSKQLQPFPQLVRKVYRQIEDVDANHFGLDQSAVLSKALKGLKAMGWTTEIGDAGWIVAFNRRFDSGQASISVEPGVHVDEYEYDGRKEQEMTVDISAKLNEIEFSELIRELQTLRK